MDANAITKSDILDFEKITGSDVGQMLKMLDATKGYVCMDCMYECTISYIHVNQQERPAPRNEGHH